MAERKFYIVRVEETRRPSLLTVEELACRCGVHPELIDRLSRLGLIDAADWDLSGEALFHREAITVIGRIMRLRNELGVNYAGVGVILELMERIEALEANIRRLEKRLTGLSN